MTVGQHPASLLPTMLGMNTEVTLLASTSYSIQDRKMCYILYTYSLRYVILLFEVYITMYQYIIFDAFLDFHVCHLISYMHVSTAIS